MASALIIGAGGFVGNFLADALCASGHQVFATKMSHEVLKKEKITTLDLDILDLSATVHLLKEVEPDWIFHLAAQSSVGLSWKNPDLTVDVNIKGALHVMEAVRQLAKKPKVLLIGSGEEYGHIQDGECPISEENPVRPGNIYAATKVEQNLLGKIYADAYGIDIMMTRSFNHIGPGQSPMFVVADFCKQVASIEKGIQPAVIRVGNLSASRDFTDVRDVVRAYLLLMEKGISGQTYNVGSGKAISIEYLLSQILKMSSADITVEIDPDKLRPIDIPIIEADITKLKNTTGWTPEIPLEDTLKDTLNDWRKISEHE